jgi:uncharacterized protein YegJ (DUF2314 family)
MHDPTDPNLPLQIGTPQAGASMPEAWRVEPQPTSLLALLKGGDTPSRDACMSALGKALGSEFKQMQDLNDPDAALQWACVLEAPALPQRLVLWCEPATMFHEMFDPRFVEGCDWMLGVETLLDAADPLSHYTTLVRMLMRGCATAPVLYDASSDGAFDRDSLERLFDDDAIEPPMEVLWCIRAEPMDGGTTWVRTQGLHRCAMPELSMAAVPEEHTPWAAELLNDLGSLLTDGVWPPPGEPMTIGADLSVSLHPTAVLDSLLPEALRSVLLEDEDGQAAGVHAFVRDAQSAALWPREVVERMQSGQAALLQSARATQRQTKIAVKTWPALCTAFEEIPNEVDDDDQPAWIVLVKTAVGEKLLADVDMPREHIWCQVRAFDGETANAVLLNAPRIDPSRSQGDAITVSREQVTDWQVLVQGEMFGPDQVDALVRMRAQESSDE